MKPELGPPPPPPKPPSVGAARPVRLRFPKLQEMTYGLRKGEITLLTAGSGIGKSTFARELAYDLHQIDGLSIGNV
jgi:replicative DNA helicase